MLQIGHLLDRKPSQLSGGQRQRVAMGRALVRNPQVFLFDEPLSNLDAKLRVDMRTEIKRLHQRMKTTIVYVTHDQIEAMTLATKIAVLKDGVLQQFGTPAEIYNNPANMFVADFMGSPAMNLVPAKIESGGNGSACRARTAGCARRCACRSTTASSALRGYAGKDVIFGIRPEALTDPDGADRNARVAGRRRLPDRSGRAGRLRHLRGDQSRRQGGGRAPARRCADCSAGPDDAARLQPGQGGVLRSAIATAYRRLKRMNGQCA